MENDVKEFLSELLKQLKSIDYIKPEDIPNIDLYMDQSQPSWTSSSLHQSAMKATKSLPRQ